MSKKLTAFRIDDEMMENLKKIAIKKERSVSSLVRLVLKKYIEMENV